MRRVIVCVVAALAFLRAAGQEESPANDKGVYREPNPPPGDVYFYETFSDMDQFKTRWVQSKAKKDGSIQYDGQWSVEAPTFIGSLDGDTGLIMTTSHKHYAIAAKLDRPFLFESTKDAFVVQFEVNFQDGLECGGAYVKLLESDDDLEEFRSDTPYSIMFGPDKCGKDAKMHLIVRFKNPITGEVEEKHSKQPTSGLDFFGDKLTHLFQLAIRNDDKYTLSVDRQVIFTGNLNTDLSPPIIPEKEIDDPNDKIPEDWDEREEIPDPEAVKPDDWDEDAPPKIPDPDAVKPDGWLDDGPELIPDPDASMPEDWDVEEDGEWEPPMIANPACEDIGCGDWSPPMISNPQYKGKWRPPMIANPDYDGVWKPRRIANPAYFELEGTVFEKITPVRALGFELWTTSKDIYFDDIVICSQFTCASSFALDGWFRKMENERIANKLDSLGPWMDYIIDLANEYPYLWGLYALALVSPFVCCAAFCVKLKPAQKKDDIGKRKKTDAPTPDDPEPPKEEEKKEEGEETGASDSNKNPTETEDDDFVASATDEENEKEKELKELEKEEEKGDEEDSEGFQVKKSPRRGAARKAKARRED